MFPKRNWLVSCLCLGILLVVSVRCMDDFSNHAITVGLTLGSPIRLGQPVTTTITVDFAEDVKGAGIDLSGDGPSGSMGTLASWPKRDAIRGQRITVSAPITLTRPGIYHLTAGVGTFAGHHNATDIRVYVDQNGAIINPTAWPAGVPAPAAASTALFPPGAQVDHSPLPTASAQKPFKPIPTVICDDQPPRVGISPTPAAGAAQPLTEAEALRKVLCDPLGGLAELHASHQITVTAAVLTAHGQTDFHQWLASPSTPVWVITFKVVPQLYSAGPVCGGALYTYDTFTDEMNALTGEHISGSRGPLTYRSPRPLDAQCMTITAQQTAAALGRSPLPTPARP